MRLHILGASGSGVTTLGKRLAAHWNITYFDSDAFFWEQTPIPFSVRRDPTRRDEELLGHLRRTEHWILGGSVIQWSQAIHALFEVIVFLHIPQALRLQRLQAREWQRYGTRLQTDRVWKNKFEAFMRWAKDYDEDTGIAHRTLTAHKRWLAQQKVKPIVLAGDVSLDQRVKRVVEQVNRLPNTI